MASCPFCNQPLRPGAHFCAKCGRALVVKNPKGLGDPSGLGSVKCPQCGTLNRVGARFCVKCRSDLPKMQQVPGQFTTRRVSAALAGVAAVLLCFIIALAAYNTRGKPTTIAVIPSPAPTPGASAAPLPQTTPSVKPTLPSASDPNFQVFTDKDFGYQITIPKSWSVTVLNGSNDGIPGSPDWSALIANVEIESLQSLMPGTDFVVSIYRKPISSEQDVLMYLLDQVTAQPDEIVRREQGKTIEYNTTKKLPDLFGHPTAARWFWDGAHLLAVRVSVLNSNPANDTQLDQALDSVRLLAP